MSHSDPSKQNLQGTADAPQRSVGADEREKHYRHLFQYTTQGVVIQDDAGRVLDMNPAAERVLGLKLEEARGHVLEQVVGKVQNEDQALVPPHEQPSALARARNTPVENVVLCVQSRRDKRWRWVMVSASPLVGETPDTSRQVFTSFANINAIKRAEEVSRKREAMWREIFNSTSDALFVHDSTTGAIVDVNQTMLDIYGYERAEALQLSVAQVSADTSQKTDEIFRELVASVVETGPKLFEWEARRKDGTVFPVEVALNASEIGGDIRVLASVRDLSMRRAAEEALRRQSLLEHLVASISTRFITTASRVDGEIERALRDISDLLAADGAVLVRGETDHEPPMVTHSWLDGGIAMSRAALHTPRRALSPEFQQHGIASQTGRMARASMDETPNQASSEAWTDVWEAGAKAIIEVPIDARSALCLVFGRRIEPRSQAELALLRVLGQVFTSALERQRIEQETEALREQLLQSQKLEAIGRLAGGVAHDFNNILTGIIGYAEMLLDELEFGPHFNDIQEIHSAASRAARLTAQLLAFSRKQLVKPRVMDLVQAVGMAKKLLARVIGEDIHFVFDPPSHPATVHADPSQIDQILVNLATNARDAMPNGGTLTIEIDSVSFDAVSAATQEGARPGDYVLLSVSDVGEGMSDEVQQRIFEPFFTTKEVGKGTGLGLSTVYGIVHQNKGFVTVTSDPGVGTTLRVYLPACEQETEETANEPPLAHPRGVETILLVEDEHIVRQLAQRVLSQYGYKVLVAADGEEALLHHQHRGHIDLLLTDVVMPGINGRELYEQLLETFPDLPVLYMSGYAEKVIAHHGVLAPGTPFIAKPFSVGMLARKVRAVLDQRKASGAS